MRKTDVSEERRAWLVPAHGFAHVSALVAPPTPRAIPADLHAALSFSAAHAALGRLEGALARIPNADMVTRTLARREAVASSQIEGTRSSLHQLLAYEATQGAGGVPVDVRVTEAYVEALQHGLEHVRTGGRAAISLALLNQLHAILMRGELDEVSAGTYRRHQVWIGPSARIEDATFVPAPPAAIQGCMQEMADSILQYAPREDEQTELALVSRLAIAHAQFETIHPYHDGNGRVGRLLIPLLLAAEGYPPLYVSGTLLRHKQMYYESLSSIQLRGEWADWCALLSRAVVESCDESLAIAEDLLALAQRWEQSLQSYRSHSATRRLPRLLIGYPVLSVQQAAAGLDVSIPAANAALGNLLDAGIVHLVEQRQWGRIFQATEVLERLDQPPAVRSAVRRQPDRATRTE